MSDKPLKNLADWKVHDALMRYATAPAEFKLLRARKLIEAQFARGDFEVLQVLDEATLEAMARALVERST